MKWRECRVKFKLFGFRSGKVWKMLLAGFTYAFIAMVFMIAIFVPTPEETTNETETEKVVEVSKPVEKEETKETAKEKEEAKIKAEEEKKKEELAKQEAAKVKAEEDKKKAEEERVKAEADAKALAEQIAKEKADKKANAQTIPYAQIKKNPDRYSGEYVKYTGEIVQILEGDDMTNIRLSVTKDSYGYSFNDLVFIEYIGYTDFVDGDIVTIYGEVYGEYSYESQAGYNISLPGIIADEVVNP